MTLRLIPLAAVLLQLGSVLGASQASNSYADDGLHCAAHDSEYVPIWSGVQGPGFRLQSHQILWIICLLCTVLTVTVSSITITRHLHHFTQPTEQVPIMRILLFAPIYAIVSFLALQFYSHAIYIFTLRDVYEAFAIYSFFSLLLHYLGRDHAEQQAYLSTKHPHRYPRPCCCIGVFTPADPRFLKRIRIQVMQFVVVKPILTVMAVVMQSLNRFCEESMRPRFGHFWYVTIGLASILTCVYGLITLLHLVQHDIPQHRATAKFWSIKGPIVIILLQSAILSSLNTSDRIPSTPSFSSASMTNAIESLLTCFEMLMVAFFHLYSFSATEYAQPREVEIPLDGVKAPTRPLTPMNAVLRTLNPVDIWVDLRHAFVHRH